MAVRESCQVGGTAVQKQDAELSALAGLTSAADKLPYFTGSGTAGLTDLTAFARTILDDADAAAARTTIGAQQADTELTALAGLTSAANKLPYFTGSGTAAVADLTAFARTILDDADAATVIATIGAQTSDATLTALAGLTITSGSLVYGTGTDAFAVLAAGTQNKVLQMGATNPGWSAYTLPASVAQGDLWYGSGTNAVSALTKDANATRYLSNTGTSNNPAWAQINLSNGVTNTLGAANGGTGISTASSTGVPSISSGTWSVAATLANTLGGTGQNSSAWTGIVQASSVAHGLPQRRLQAIIALLEALPLGMPTPIMLLSGPYCGGLIIVPCGSTQVQPTRAVPAPLGQMRFAWQARSRARVQSMVRA